jgi:hypothetical protein
MIARFNGANENGTEFNPIWPLDATRDSLYGNVEAFNGLQDILPIFKLTGLTVDRPYQLTLFASRTSVGDVRETRYTVSGMSTNVADLDAANNIENMIVLENVLPDANGEIRIALTPGPNNNNGNHFVYLGVLQLDWTNALIVRPTLSEPSYANGSFRMRVTGAAGKTYKILRSADFTGWMESGVTVTLSGTSDTVTIPQAESMYFYRAVEQ